MGRKPREPEQPHKGATVRYISGFFAGREGVLARRISTEDEPEFWAVSLDGHLIASLVTHFIVVRAARERAA